MSGDPFPALGVDGLATDPELLAFVPAVNTGSLPIELGKQMGGRDVVRVGPFAADAQAYSSRLAVRLALWNGRFARMVKDVCPDARVYCRVAGAVYDLWTVLPVRDTEMEGRVTERMCELMRRYPDVRFEFLVLTQEDPCSVELHGDEFVVIPAD